MIFVTYECDCSQAKMKSLCFLSLFLHVKAGELIDQLLDPAVMYPGYSEEASTMVSRVTDGCLKCQAADVPAPPNGCAGPDCVIYDLSSQSQCTEVILEKPTMDPRWSQGLSLYVDNQILGGDVVAYKIQWFDGRMSDWYVPGVNDLDWKLTGCSMRRAWSYFEDHYHSYIICK